LGSFKALGVDPSERIHFVDEETSEARDIECGVLMGEPNLNPQANRERRTQIMFERFGVPNFYLKNDATLAVYAVGRNTATVIDFGWESFNGILIYEGYSLPHTAKTPALSAHRRGGHGITCSLGMALGLHDVALNPASYAYAESIKHQYGGVRIDPLAHVAPAPPHRLTLPDGRSVELGHETMLEATEELWTSNSPVQDLVRSVIYAGDVDIRSDMTNNVVIHGGSTRLSGFRERLETEVKRVLPPAAPVKVVQSPEDAVWMGGSIISSLSIFDRQWISQAEYDEDGPSIVQRKCCE
jgi:actin, other eukaryote